jgi:dihydroxyacid dehydratase/phosphogluconate dehydratase
MAWSIPSIRAINDESLEIDENCVMVLKNCGPRGYPGMAEVGNMPLPLWFSARALPIWFVCVMHE